MFSFAIHCPSSIGIKPLVQSDLCAFHCAPRKHHLVRDEYCPDAAFAEHSNPIGGSPHPPRTAPAHCKLSYRRFLVMGHTVSLIRFMSHLSKFFGEGSFSTTNQLSAASVPPVLATAATAIVRPSDFRLRLQVGV